MKPGDKNNLPISHHTGTKMIALSLHIIEFIPKTRFEINNQAMRESVAIFLALQCQGRGARQRAAAVKAPIGSSACILSETYGKCERKLFCMLAVP